MGAKEVKTVVSAIVTVTTQALSGYTPDPVQTMQESVQDYAVEQKEQSQQNQGSSNPPTTSR